MSFDFLECIDEKATISKAKKVLKNWVRLDRIAKAYYSLGSSSAFSETTSRANRHQAGAKHENFLMKSLSAEQERNNINRAIEELEEPYRSILFNKFCTHQKAPDFVICQKLGYSESTFYNKQNQALLQFAECYKGGELLTLSD